MGRVEVKFWKVPPKNGIEGELLEEITPYTQGINRIIKMLCSRTVKRPVCVGNQLYNIYV